MKTKNQTEHHLLELAATTAANEDGISPAASREALRSARKQAWSPLEVWRTRVKVPAQITLAGFSPDPALTRRRLAPRRPNTYKAVSTLGDPRRLGRMAPTKNSSPNNSDAARLLAKGFRFLRFDEPLESEFRTEHRIAPACLESHRDHGVGLHGARLRDPRSLRPLRRALAHHQHGALRHARAGGHPHAHLHLEALLRSLV